MTKINHEIPAIWKELLEKKEWLQEGDIAMGFSPSFGEESGWFGDFPDMEKKLVFLGQADGTGAEYAIFWVDETKPLAENPTIFLGSEGSILMASSDLKGLLQLISIGNEPTDYGPLRFAVDEEYEGHCLADYREWLETKGIQPIDLEICEEESDKIVQEATAKYGKALEDFLEEVGFD